MNIKVINYKKKTLRSSMFKNMTFEEFLSSNGFTATQDSVREDATAMACINAISSYISSMSLRLYAETDNGTSVVVNELTNKLGRPNTLQSDFEFMKIMIQEMLIYGQSFARVKYRGAKLVAIEYIQNGVLSETYQGSGKWVVSGSINGYSVKVPYDSVIHFRDLFDRSKALKVIIETKNLANGLINGSFDSGLQHNVKAVISLDGKASNETKTMIKEAFNKVLKSSNDYTAVVDSGMKYDVVNSGGSHSFQESQLDEILDLLDKQIHKLFNVPMVITSVAEGSYNISESLIAQFVKSLLPIVKGIEKELNYKLLSTIEQKNHYFKLDYRSLMRASDKDRAEYYSKMLANGTYSINDVLSLENMNPIYGGDVHLMSLNYVPLEKYQEYLDKRYASQSVTTQLTDDIDLKGGEEDETQVL